MFSVVVFTMEGEEPFGDFQTLDEVEAALIDRLSANPERSGTIWFDRGPDSSLEPLARVVPQR